MGGGASKNTQQQITQNRDIATTTGGNLGAQANNYADAYHMLAEKRRQQGDQAYQGIASGNGGYSMDAKDAITDPEGLKSLPQDTGIGSTTEGEYGSNYLTNPETQGIMGDQSGINSVEGDIGQNVQDYTSQVRLTPEQQQQMVTSAARSQSNVDKSAAESNIERARAAGMDPLGVASYTDRNNRQSLINTANTAAAARVQGEQERVNRENMIEGVTQNANTQKLGTEQTKEQNASTRSGTVATNRQNVNYSNQNQKYNQQQQNMNEKFQQGAYVEGQGAQRAQTVADAQRSDEKEYRDWLASQQQGYLGAGTQQQGIGAGLYGTEGTQLGNATSTQVEADKRPAWWQSVLSAGAQVGAGYAKASDVRLKENVVKVGELGPLNVYEYNFIGKPDREVGFMAQEAYQHFPQAVEVGGVDPIIQPWKINYAALLAELGVN